MFKSLSELMSCQMRKTETECFFCVGKSVGGACSTVSSLREMLDGIGSEHVNLQIFTAELFHSCDVFIGPPRALKSQKHTCATYLPLTTRKLKKRGGKAHVII